MTQIFFLPRRINQKRKLIKGGALGLSSTSTVSTTDSGAANDSKHPSWFLILFSFAFKPNRVPLRVVNEKKIKLSKKPLLQQTRYGAYAVKLYIN